MTPAGQAPAAAQPPEQQRYASLLAWCTRIGLVVTVLAFIAYASGLVPARVPVEQLAQLWTLPAAQYAQATGSAGGWSWLALLGQHGHADLAALAGIALLAGSSVVPLLALVPLYLRRGDRAFAALCLAEVAVIVLAASGWMASGH